jgi:hypothetical protein
MPRAQHCQRVPMEVRLHLCSRAMQLNFQGSVSQSATYKHDCGAVGLSASLTTSMPA